MPKNYLLLRYNNIIYADSTIYIHNKLNDFTSIGQISMTTTSMAESLIYRTSAISVVITQMGITYTHTCEIVEE